MKNGYVYTGEFNEGKVTGKGLLSSVPDSMGKKKTWDGTFVDGKLEGIAILTELDGSSKKGFWKNGELERWL